MSVKYSLLKKITIERNINTKTIHKDKIYVILDNDTIRVFNLEGEFIKNIRVPRISAFGDIYLYTNGENLIVIIDDEVLEIDEDVRHFNEPENRIPIDILAYKGTINPVIRFVEDKYDEDLYESDEDYKTNCVYHNTDKETIIKNFLNYKIRDRTLRRKIMNDLPEGEMFGELMDSKTLCIHNDEITRVIFLDNGDHIDLPFIQPYELYFGQSRVILQDNVNNNVLYIYRVDNLESVLPKQIEIERNEWMHEKRIWKRISEFI